MYDGMACQKGLELRFDKFELYESDLAQNSSFIYIFINRGL